MMFISGFMMALAGLNGNGNDTKTLPAVIALAGVVLSFWSFYRLGYIKSNLEKETAREKKAVQKRVFWLQIAEAALYLAVMILGIYLFINESFTNKVLDLMCGGFTILNGVFGILWISKNNAKHNFSWKFRIGLTVVEFMLGTYFIIASNSINSTGYLIMGSITTVAGIIEIAHAITRENIESTIKDSKDIVKTFKNKPEEIDDSKEYDEDER